MLTEWRSALATANQALNDGDATSQEAATNALRTLNDAVKKEYEKALQFVGTLDAGTRRSRTKTAKREVDYDAPQLASKK